MYFRKIIILYKACLFILFLMINDDVKSQCLQNFNWTNWTSFTNNSATGTVLYNGQPINVVMSANYDFSSTPSIFNYPAFSNFYNPPPNNRVPQTTWVIGQGGQTTMCFSTTVENPVLLIASQGNPGRSVSLKFSRPYILVYDGGGNSFPNDSTIIGAEGYSIIKFPGKFDCVTIYSSDYEFYTNITWGLNPPLFPISVVNNSNSCNQASYTASGGTTYAWSGGLYPNNATNVFTSSGTYFLTVTDDKGCSVNTSVDVNLVGTPSLVLSKGSPDQTICVNTPINPIEYLFDATTSNVSVTGLPPGLTQTSSNGVLKIAGTPTSSSATPFLYSITTVAGCGTSKNSGTIKVNPEPKVNAGVDQRVTSGSLVKLEGQVTGTIQNIQWTPATDLNNANSLTPSFTISKTQLFTLTITSQDNCIGSDQVLIELLSPIKPPNVFSPNNDGINDKWFIQNVDLYNNVDVKIFNRYGVVLYERKGYSSSNAWDGTYNGKQLPVGSYFYVIKDADNKILSGVVSILR
jgi:gliding motility-associated-like protein